MAKLRRPTSAAMAIADFGLTRRVHPRLGLVLGIAETALALALAFGGPYSRAALTVAAVLLWAFTLLIARSLWLGNRFPCSCFGGEEHDISRWTLFRTASLSVLVSIPVAADVTTGVYRDVGGIQALEFSVAAAILGTVVLGASISRLMKWNRDAIEALTRGSGGGP